MAKRETEIPARLRRLKKRFANWRRTRERGERIPDRLWEAAARAAGEFGVCQTAKVLTLDYYALRRRLPEQPGTSALPAFLELPTSGVASECIIELEDGHGLSMRMHVKGVDQSMIAAIGQGLWTAK